MSTSRSRTATRSGIGRQHHGHVEAGVDAGVVLDADGEAVLDRQRVAEGAGHGEPAAGDGQHDVGPEPAVGDLAGQLPGRRAEQLVGEHLAVDVGVGIVEVVHRPHPSGPHAPRWLAVLIRGGTVVDVDGERVADVRVGADGRIAEVGPSLVAGRRRSRSSRPPAGWSCPGGVDAHTHLHLHVGAAEVSDDFASGTAAAAVGGTTTVIEYVTTTPGPAPARRAGRLAARGRAGGHRLRLPHDARRGGDRGRRGRLRRAGDHLVQALHGLPRDAAGRRRRHRRRAAPHRQARRAGHRARRERRSHHLAAPRGAARGPHRRHRALAHPAGRRRGRGHGPRRGAGRAGRGARSTSCT